MKDKDIADKKVFVRGLEGVAAGETKISYVDGVNGLLVYSGYNIHEIAEKISFEEVAYLLWHDHDKLPNEREYERFSHELIKNMYLPFEAIQLIKQMPEYSHPMAILRTVVSLLGALDPDAEELSGKIFEKKAISLLGRIMTAIAVMYRVKTGQRILEADFDKSFAENFLYMMFERVPEEEEVRAFDTILVLHADHGFNASTFSARITTSTLSDIYSALTTAIGTLKGPLHGGANQKVLEMLQDIKSIDKVDEYIDNMLENKKKIMGFGHRVYKTEDPRARHLREWAEKLAKKKGHEKLYDIAKKIESIVIEKKGIYPNVDFYSAVVQNALGIPKEYYTTIFAASRTAGWIAHIREQLTDNRLIRPTSRYEGALDKKFIPLKDRK
jgi:citrate synthase